MRNCTRKARRCSLGFSIKEQVSRGRLVVKFCGRENVFYLFGGSFRIHSL